MTKTLVAEKAGQKLRADYFLTPIGAGVRFYVNEQVVKEEIYEGKNIYFALDAAENWLAGVGTLNG